MQPTATRRPILATGVTTAGVFAGCVSGTGGDNDDGSGDPFSVTVEDRVAGILRIRN
ncbi:hypothetical protein [Natronorubrum sp. FCH18a]|uniref:hypothetical protein n=1 Tax=Natronorubrum sp. FCH18a TaxID=3447018 RepID=UPI003F51A84B